jgi:hypothetical protein
MQIELSDKAIKVLNSLMATVQLRPMDERFLETAEGVAEIIAAIKPQEPKDGATNV